MFTWGSYSLGVLGGITPCFLSGLERPDLPVFVCVWGDGSDKARLRSPDAALGGAYSRSSRKHRIVFKSCVYGVFNERL